MSYTQMFDNFIWAYKKNFLRHILFACGVWAVIFLTDFLINELDLFKVVIRAFIESDFGISAANYAFGFIGICLLVVFLLLSSLSALSHCFLTADSVLKPLNVKFNFRGYLRVLSVVVAQIVVVIPVILIFVLLFYIVCKQTGLVFDLLSIQKVLTSPSFVTLALTFSMLLLLALHAIFVAFSCAVPIAIIEKQAFFKPLIRSIKTVSGEFWKLFSLLLLWYAGLGLIAFGSYLFLYFIGFAVNPESPGNLLWINNIFWIIFTPFVGIVSTVIYRRQSEKMLGLDIICLIKGLERDNYKNSDYTREDINELSSVYRELDLSNSPHYQTDESYRDFITPTKKLFFAGAGSRMVAAVADLFIKFTLSACLILPIFGSDMSKLFSAQNVLPVLGAMLVLGLSYFILCETLLNGQTPGKMLLNLRTVSEVDGNKYVPIGIMGSVTRNLFRFFVDYSLVGPVTIIMTNENRRVGDILAGSYVVSKPEPDKHQTVITDLLNNYFTKVDNTSYRLSKPECFALLSYFIKKSSFADKGQTVSNYLRPYFSKRLSIPPNKISDEVLFSLINLK